MPASITALFLAHLLAAPAPSHQGPIDAWLWQIEQPPEMKQALALWTLKAWWGLLDGPRAERLEAALARLADNRRTPLPLKRLALRQLARRQASAGRASEADATRRRLGWIEDWWLAGPFDDALRDGLERPYAPEQGVDLTADVPCKTGPAPWRPLPAEGPDGRIRLHPLLDPHTSVVAYAFTVVSLPKARRAVLSLGCDDGCKVWIDGQLVVAAPGPHDLRPDQHLVRLDLAAGAHRILTKVVQDSGEMGFSLGLTTPRGEPLPGLQIVTDRAELQRHLAGEPPKAPATAEVQSLADWFEARAEEAPEDPARQAQAGWAIFHTAARDRRKALAEQYLLRAIALSGAKGTWATVSRLWLARVTEDDGLTREQLEPLAGDPAVGMQAMARLGLLHQVRGETARALSAHRRALALAPDYLPSLIGQAELNYDLGFVAKAEKEMAALTSAHPDVPEVWIAAGNLHRRAGNRDRARQAFERLVELDATDVLGLRAMHELELEAGHLDAALGWLERLIALDPLRADRLLRLGQLEAANGRTRAALSAFERASALSPRNPLPFKAQGEALLRAGRRDEAQAAWQRALELAPQDHQLQRRLEALEPTGEAFYSPWQVEAQHYLAEPDPAPPTASATRLQDIRVVRLLHNGMASTYHQRIVRIHDARAADRFRTFRVEYAPARQEVRLLSSRVLSPDGQIRSGVMVDDISLSEPWYNLYYDVHARLISFPELSPGDLVEVTTVLQDQGGSALLGDYFGDLVPLQYAEPVQHSTYVLLAPAGLEVAFNRPDGVEHSVQTADGGGRIHTWTAGPLPGVETEPGMPGFTETHRYLHLSTQSSWAALGRWYRAMVADQLQPDAKVRDAAADLVEGKKDPLAKVRAIYRSVADGTRYVGLEFGIHSYVPYRVGQVLKRKYGDCKDKSALLVALLDAAGIRARLALVRMKRLGAFSEPPGGGPASLAVFNHAICYLPDLDLWLDGTAALHDIEDLPAQDQGVQALVVGPEGDRLVITPATGPERNWTRLRFTVRPAADLSAKLAAGLDVSGVLAPEMRLRLLSGPGQEQAFAQIIEEVFPGARVESVSSQNLNDPGRPLKVRAELSVPKLGEQRGGDLELPALGKDIHYQRMLASLQARQHDLVMGPAWAVAWELELHAPPGMLPASVPPGGTIEAPFGRAEITFERQASLIRVQAELALKVDRVKAEDYPTFRDFLGRVDKLLSKRVQFTGAGHARNR